jgi:hypothetical protein
MGQWLGGVREDEGEEQEGREWRDELNINIIMWFIEGGLNKSHDPVDFSVHHAIL